MRFHHGGRERATNPPPRLQQPTPKRLYTYTYICIFYNLPKLSPSVGIFNPKKTLCWHLPYKYTYITYIHILHIWIYTLGAQGFSLCWKL